MQVPISSDGDGTARFLEGRQTIGTDGDRRYRLLAVQIGEHK